MRIQIKDWMIGSSEGNLVASGIFAIKAGDKEITTEEFSIGFPDSSISMPSEIVELKEKIVDSLREALEKHFTE